MSSKAGNRRSGSIEGGFLTYLTLPRSDGILGTTLQQEENIIILRLICMPGLAQPQRRRTCFGLGGQRWGGALV